MQKFDPRSPAKKAKDAIYKALPPAVIVKPLRFIGDNTNTTVVDANGVTSREPSQQYIAASLCAQDGNGRGVKAIARNVARAQG